MEAQAIADDAGDELGVGTSLRGEASLTLATPADVTWLRWYFRGTSEGASLAALSNEEVLQRLAPWRDSIADRWEDHVQQVLQAAVET